MGTDTKQEIKSITRNRKALHNYFVDEEFEAGIVLYGSEVKSLRDGRVQLTDAYARFDRNELWLISAHIQPYPFATHVNHEPERPRKLLLHRRELNKLRNKVETSGYTLIPLELYFVGNKVKVRLGLCRGKKLFDKRETVRKREAAREIARVTQDARRTWKD
jgi:SsrA-binding protein